MPDAEQTSDKGGPQGHAALLTITDALKTQFGSDALAVAERQLAIAEEGSRVVWLQVVSTLRISE